VLLLTIHILHNSTTTYKSRIRLIRLDSTRLISMSHFYLLKVSNNINNDKKRYFRVKSAEQRRIVSIQDVIFYNTFYLLKYYDLLYDKRRLQQCTILYTNMCESALSIRFLCSLYYWYMMWIKSLKRIKCTYSSSRGAS
jgi:hypothetical protein